MSKIPDIFGEGRIYDATFVVLSGIVQAIGAGLVAFATRDIFRSFHTEAPLSTSPLVMLILGGFLIAAMRATSRIISERLGQNFAIALRHTLFMHLSGMSHSQVANKRAGAMGLRFVGDLTAARNWVGLGLTRIFSAAFILPGAALALFLLNPILAGAVSLPILIALLAMALLSRWVESLHRTTRSKRANIAITMMERVAVAPELDLIGRTKKELKALTTHGEALRNTSVARTQIVSLLRSIPELGSVVAGAMLLWVASTKGIPAAEAAGSLAILGILVLPLRELADVWDRRCAWVIAREKCEIVFAKPSKIRRRKKGGGATKVAFNMVKFREIECNYVINAGEVISIKGLPSSGKSSFLRLAASLEKPDEGSVTYNKRGVLPVTVFLDQHTPILQGSLRRALSLGISPRPKDEDIIAKACKFGLGSLLDQLGGLEGKVGEGARTVSANEKIRLLMTRAVLSKPDLLIVDLPLGILDSGINQNIETLIQEASTTTLMADPHGVMTNITDRYFKLDHGKVIEQTGVSSGLTNPSVEISDQSGLLA